MTVNEQEAIEVLKRNKPTSDPRKCGKELCAACDVAIKALEENKQLKENGCFTGLELAIIATQQSKLKEYESIGTVEECRNAVKKQRMEDVVPDGAFAQCPECGAEFNSELVSEYDIGFCPWCGQAVEFRDWSAEE